MDKSFIAYFFIFSRIIYSITIGRCLISKELSCNAGDTGDSGLIPGLWRSTGGRHGNSLLSEEFNGLRSPGLKWLRTHTHIHTHACMNHSKYFWKLKSLNRVRLFATPWTVHRLYNPQGSPGQNTEVSSLFFSPGDLPNRGSNPGLPHCRRILYQLSHKGSPIILERVAYPFSSWSSQPRNRTRVSCIAGDSLPTELWCNSYNSIFN